MCRPPSAWKRRGMARKYRLVVENSPHHVIQRGNRRQRVFFSDQDKQKYLTLLKKNCDENGVRLWAYCLMDNHVHLVLVPSSFDGLAKAVGRTHWRYTLSINRREQWRGYLWQGRFSSFVLQGNYLRAVIRYVELNPVRAGIVRKADSYPWSSAAAHIKKFENKYLSYFPLLDEIQDWQEYLEGVEEESDLKLFRKHLSTGRPLGGKEFLQELSGKLGIDLMPKRSGPKPRIKCVSP